MEKDTNVKINWQYAGDADWSEQESLLLASGDLPDVFFGDNALKDNDIATLPLTLRSFPLEAMRSGAGIAP